MKKDACLEMEFDFKGGSGWKCKLMKQDTCLEMEFDYHGNENGIS